MTRGVDASLDVARQKADPPGLPRLLRLGGERRGEQRGSTSKERAAVHPLDHLIRPYRLTRYTGTWASRVLHHGKQRPAAGHSLEHMRPAVPEAVFPILPPDRAPCARPSTSPGLASAATRAPMCTAMPPIFSPILTFAGVEP